MLAAVTEGGAKAQENGAEKDLILGRDSKAEARLFAPSGWGGPLIAREFLGLMGPGGFNGARSAIMMTMKGQEFAKASGLAVVNVFYVVDFAQAETYGGAFRNVSAVNVKAGLATVPEASKLVVLRRRDRSAPPALREPVRGGRCVWRVCRHAKRRRKGAEHRCQRHRLPWRHRYQQFEKVHYDSRSRRLARGLSELMNATNAQFTAAMN